MIFTETDIRQFSKMTTQECFNTIIAADGKLTEYGENQIEEMMSLKDHEKILCPDVVVVSAEYDIVRTDISVEKFEKFYAENYTPIAEEKRTFSELCTARCNKIIKINGNGLNSYSVDQLADMFIDKENNKVFIRSKYNDRLYIQGINVHDLVDMLKYKIKVLNDRLKPNIIAAPETKENIYDKPFSELSEEEILKVVEKKGKNIDLYTDEQIGEMKLYVGSIMHSKLLIISDRGLHIGTGITIKDIKNNDRCIKILNNKGILLFI
jgi:hypothetical protein